MAEEEQRWPITQQYRDATIRRLVKIIADPASSPREAVSAARVLIAAESQNQVDENGAETIGGRINVFEVARKIGVAKIPESLQPGTSKSDKAVIKRKASQPITRTKK